MKTKILLVALSLIPQIGFAETVSAKDCEWLNRYYYESYCGVYSYAPSDPTTFDHKTAKQGAQIDPSNQHRQGVCAGEMVCKGEWNYTAFKFDPKAKFDPKNPPKPEKVSFEAGVYPLNCPARFVKEGDSEQTCDGVTVEKCIAEHVKTLTVPLTNKETEGSGSAVRGGGYLNQQLTGPKANQRNGAKGDQSTTHKK